MDNQLKTVLIQKFTQILIYKLQISSTVLTLNLLIKLVTKLGKKILNFIVLFFNNFLGIF